jgi:oligopeptide transport system substrate-binding protein
MKKRGFLALAFVLIACLMSGCSGTEKNDVVSYVVEAEPASLDPAMTTALTESNLELALYEGLTRLDEHNEPKPALASSWDISSDGRVYTFHLRPGICWSDGTPIHADDFVYSWKRVIDPDVASPNAYMMYPIKGAEECAEEGESLDDVAITALDDTTLQVTLKEPTAYFLNLTAFHCFYPVPRHLVEEKPDTWAADSKGLVSSGPFKITKWIHSSEIAMERNESYWDADHVKSDCIEFPISDSQATRLTMVESGQANLTAEPPPAEQQRLETLGLYHISPYLGCIYLTFNVEKKPFDDIRVRKAYAYAMEREGLITNIVRGGKQPAYAFVPPGIENPVTKRDFREEGGELQIEDGAKARELLEEAGYGAGSEPDVTLLFGTNEMNKAIAEGIQAMWLKNLGVHTQLMNQENKVVLASATEGNFQIVRSSWIADYDDPMTFLDVFYDDANDGRYHSEAYKGLIKKAKETNDKGLRMTYMHEAEQILFDDCVMIPIYFSTLPYVAQPYVKGFHWSPLGLIDLKGAYIEQP